MSVGEIESLIVVKLGTDVLGKYRLRDLALVCVQW